jgi:hypothetical protein
VSEALGFLRAREKEMKKMIEEEKEENSTL